jgi:NRPS condensation-like uncharacterized protein
MPKNDTAKRPKGWLKLDNAAKIYPAAMSRNWTAIFRLSATLREAIDPGVLSQALASTLGRIPGFSLRLRRGLFWYYLEHMDGAPEVEPDVANPCMNMDVRGKRGFMFRVRYHANRIAVEIFHVLADGTGGMIFLKTLVAEYLRLRHGALIPRGDGILDCSESPKPGELEDSFAVHARPETLSRAESSSYRIRGTVDNRNDFNIVTGVLPSGEVRARAKTYGATVTEYLVAALVMAVHDIQKSEISRRRRRMQVKICVPVNLRKFYPSSTLRNFSSFINPGINARLGSYTFEETLNRVRHLMGLDADEKMINARMSRNVYDERNPIIRLVPLFLKDPTLKYMFWKNGDRVSSTTLSNLGVVKLPDEMARHVERFDFLLGSLLYNPVTCACVTYDDKLVVNFTRYIKEPMVERNFFTFLVKEGIRVTLESNRRY